MGGKRIVQDILILAVASLAFSSAPASATEIVGRASIIDGDTLEIRSNRIRLWGIDAPEHDQLCRGGDSLQYRCGAKAANALDQFIASRPVNCTPLGTDRYGRTVASCSIADVDLGQWLVAHGYALDWPRFSNGKYERAQREAERGERGIWDGSFVPPWRYRACVLGGDSVAHCSDDAK